MADETPTQTPGSENTTPVNFATATTASMPPAAQKATARFDPSDPSSVPAVIAMDTSEEAATSPEVVIPGRRPKAQKAG